MKTQELADQFSAAIVLACTATGSTDPVSVRRMRGGHFLVEFEAPPEGAKDNFFCIPKEALSLVFGMRSPN